MYRFTWVEYLLMFFNIFLFLYFYLTRSYNHFKKKGIPYETPHLIRSIFEAIFQKENIFDITEKTYALAKKTGLSGTFHQNQPVLMIGSQELLKLVTIRDFNHFSDHKTFSSVCLLEKNLFSLKGAYWRKMRSKLSPAFSGSRLRCMFDLIQVSAKQIDNYIMKEFKRQQSNNVSDIVLIQEMKELFTRFTNDAIATSAFGYEVDSLADPENDFFKMGSDLTDFTSGLRWVKGYLAMHNPFLFKIFFRNQLFSPRAYNFFQRLVQENLTTRRNENIIRNDLIHHLMEAQKKINDPNDLKLTDDDIICQAILFFFAGFDTISSTLSIIAHQLAEFPKVQQKLAEEIDQKFEETNGEITYDILMKEMPYLNIVCDECQRRIPVAPTIERLCTKTYVFPATDKRPEYIIKPGEQIKIPVYGFHRDPEFFPRPDELIPERWNNESQNKSDVFMPFGKGPRVCIASQFAKMEMKLALFYLLKNSKLVFIDKTQHPLKLSQGITLINKAGFWLGIKPRERHFLN